MIAQICKYLLLFLMLGVVLEPLWAETSSDLQFSPEKRLSDRELEDKREGSYVTGIGGPVSSPDIGFALGGALFYFFNGDKHDPRFAYTPYLHKLELSGTYSTKELVSSALVWEAPYIGKSPYTFFAVVNFYNNPVAQYFGQGEETLSSLRHPQGERYQEFGSYNEDLRRIDSTGQTYAYYNYYGEKELKAELNLIREFARGTVRLLTGLVFRYTRISDYSYDTIEVDGSDAVMRRTLLKFDYQEGKIIGYNGGHAVPIKLGIAYDTRDLPPNPRKGVFADLVLLQTSEALASQFSYGSLSHSLRGYSSPFDGLDLVLAGRMFGVYHWGDTPFYELRAIHLMDRDVNGLGGMYSLRGYREPRFLGPLMVGFNLEIRYHFLSWRWGESNFKLMLAPFFDMGRVYDDSDAIFCHWPYSYGGALRFVWNQATVISLDVGFSREETALVYLNVNQIF
jgi:hypothetical protein